MVRELIRHDPDEPVKWRHYTIANVMRRLTYHKFNSLLGENLNKSLNSEDSKEEVTEQDLVTLLDQQDQNSMLFTVKNYRRESCVSEKFFRKSGAIELEVKGPMGKGLQAEKTGCHVAFAAGTGVLTFMDLVAHIAAHNLGYSERLGVNPDDCIQPGFKLILHLSYARKEDTIGLELCNKLNKFCKANNFDNFELYVRITKENLNPARWD